MAKRLSCSSGSSFTPAPVRRRCPLVDGVAR
jgi:hypothetical protein